MLWCDIWRTQHHAVGNAIELDQRESGGKLIPCEEHDALIAQLLETTPEARGACKVSQRDELTDAV
jgi:hypothetical protein